MGQDVLEHLVGVQYEQVPSQESLCSLTTPRPLRVHTIMFIACVMIITSQEKMSLSMPQKIRYYDAHVKMLCCRGLNCNTDGAEHYNIVIGNGEKTYKV